MATVDIQSGYLGYASILDQVLRTGRWRSPRGQRTLDAGVTTIRVANPHSALPVGQGRNLNPAIGAAEALQLIGGFSSPSLMRSISANFESFIDANGRFHGAYGTRVKEQVPCAIVKLRRDESTRQAVVTLWDPFLDNIPGHLDYPCTVGFNIALTDDDALTMNVIMRSSDAWLGIPYDIFQFTQLQLTVAHALQLHAGEFTLTTWSLHLYERDIDAVERFTGPTAGPQDWIAYQPRGVGRFGDSFTERMLRARVLGGAASLRSLDERGPIESIWTESEEWYRAQLAPHLG